MIIVTTTARREERDYAMWSEGYHLGEDETDAALAEKDAFIEQQSGIIQQLIEGDLIDWMRVPEELRNALADYV